MKLKIGLVVPGLSLGGGVPAVARFLQSTITASDRFEARVISLSTSAHDSSNTPLVRAGVGLREVGIEEAVWDDLSYSHVGAFAGEIEFQRYRPRAALARLLSDCQLVQVVSGAPAWANAVIGLGKPVALHVATRARIERRQRDATPRGVIGWWRRGMTEITDLMDDRALRRVDAIQVMNPWMLAYARSLNAGRDVDLRYAPPGIDSDVFRPLKRRDPTINPYILCVGRLDDPRKNVGLLLESYSRLPDGLRASVSLVLAGYAGPPREVWRRVDQLGLSDRVSFISRPDRQALVSLYANAAVFALSSDEEGFGVVLLEAMACGIPVVSTSSGGPDAIISDGCDGHLVPLNDPDQMASRLGELLTNPILNVEMGIRARATIEQRYDEKVAGKVFIDVWDQLALKAPIG